MKVRELIELLTDCDPEADVLLASQPHYPLEHALAGLTVRADVDAAEEDDEEAEDGEDGPFSDDSDGRRRSDVLLLEGSQLRYGDRSAWDQARG